MQGQISKGWQVGDIFLNLYQVWETLGQNSVATLYKVRHLGWNIDLMAKVPQAKILQSIGGPENFAEQIEVWADLGTHPHLVTCYYVRTMENIPLVFTEYVNGDTLYEQIRQGILYQGGVQQSQQRILDIAIQSAWGLHYIHEQGVIHSCVQPDNVLVSARGVAKVTDLGMSYDETPAYCSPEQAKLQPLTPGSDSWSWGLLLLEMFQGQRTWSTGTSAARSLKHYQGDRDNRDTRETSTGSAKAPLPSMPAEVGWLLRRCFRKNPADRPSLLDLASELQKVYQSVMGAPYPRKQPNASKETPESLNNKALSLIDLGKQSLALQLWEQALEIQPILDSVYNRGLILWRTGRIHDRDLIGELEKLRHSAAGTELVDYLLSLVHLERDDCDRACKLLDKIFASQLVDRRSVQEVKTIAQRRSPESMRLVRTFEDHTSLIKSVCFSADGRYVLSGCDRSQLKLWTIETGECVSTFSGHTQEVKCVCISGDSKYAISASWDKTIKLWDVEQGICLRSFQPHESEIFTICLSVDGTQALSGSDDRFSLWQIQTGECLRSFAGHKGDIFSLALSRDGQYALSGSLDKTVKLWDINTGACVQTLYGHQREVTSVCLSTDGQFALSGSSDQTLKLWQLSTGQCVRTLSGHTNEVTSVCLTADGQIALSGSSDHTLKLWQLSSGRCLRTFEGHTSAVTSTCLSPDDAYALSGSMDDTLKLWSVKMPAKLYQAPMRLSVDRPGSSATLDLPDREHSEVDNRTLESWEQGVRLSTSEAKYTGEIPPVNALIGQRNYVAAAGQIRKLRQSAAKESSQQHSDGTYFSAWRQLYLCLPRKGFVAAYPGIDLGEQQDAISAVSLSQDGRYAVSAGRGEELFAPTVKLWALSSGRSLRIFEGHKDLVQSVCLSANSTHVLSGSADGTVRLWAVATGLCVLTLTGHSCGVTSVCFSADGNYVLSGSSDRTLKFWQVASGECLYTFKGHNAPVTAVCLSRDGRYALSGSADTTLKIWHLTQQKCLHTFKGHQEAVTAVSISADGYVALSGSADRTLKLWQVTDAKCLQTLVGHTDGVSSVCLTLDGRYAISGSRDQTVKVWQVAAGQCLHTLAEMTGPVNSVAMSADGSYALCGGCCPSALKLWKLDWELEDRQTVPWAESAQPYLEAFLMLHSQTAAHQPPGDRLSDDERDDERDIPTWTEADFTQLLHTLGCAGYGWLEPAGVRAQLETMTANWQWLSPFISEVSEDSEEEGTQLLSFSESNNPSWGTINGEPLSAGNNVELMSASPSASPHDESVTQLFKAVSSRPTAIGDRLVSDRLQRRPTVTLTIESGSLKGQKFQFDSRCTCAIGRGKDCYPQLPNDSTHQTISRYHCLLDINPPAICIRDLNSKNGTIVNSKILGRSGGTDTEVECDLRDGDRFQLGYTLFRVHIDRGFYPRQ